MTMADGHSPTHRIIPCLCELSASRSRTSTPIALQGIPGHGHPHPHPHHPHPLHTQTQLPKPRAYAIPPICYLLIVVCSPLRIHPFKASSFLMFLDLAHQSVHLSPPNHHSSHDAFDSETNYLSGLFASSLFLLSWTLLLSLDVGVELTVHWLTLVPTNTKQSGKSRDEAAGDSSTVPTYMW